MTLDKIIEKQVNNLSDIWEVLYTYDRDTAEGRNPYCVCTEKVKTFLRQAIRQAVEEYEKLLSKEEK